MPPRQSSPSNPRTRLAKERIKKGFTQQDMAARTGIKLPTYRRLERGTLPTSAAPNPPIRLIANCARVLDVGVMELWEPVWSEWLDLGVAEPTAKERAFWESVAYMWLDPDEGASFDKWG